MNTNYSLPTDFYKEEVRCGYTVTEKKKKIWSIELDLLNELLRVCNKYNIRVFAYAGTLLGAVRHQGFIPWDDDVDVCLLHDDYLKLVEVAAKEFKDPYFFQTAITDKQFFFRYARLRNSNTTGFITEYKSKNYNQGIFLDIFVLNGFQENEQLLKIQRFKMKIAWKMCRAYIADISQKKGVKKYFIALTKKIEHLIFSYEQLVNWNWRIQSKYDHSSSRVTLLTHGEKLMRKYWCSVSCFDDTIYLPFENLLIPVPYKYEEFLKNAYGDYMKYPPLEDRGKWHDNTIIFEPDIPYTDYIRREFPEL